MPSKRTAITIPEAELRALLEQARTLQVASIGSDGQPHLVPMWFAVDEEGRLVFTTYRRSQKILNLERDPRVTALVEDGDVYDELRGVMIEGTAEILDDNPEVTREVMRLVGQKYYGGERRPEGATALPQRSRAIPKRVAVRIQPERVVSWDHSRLLDQSSPD